ncbi:MAG: 50S ribosomal protein L11 methyltransferase [Geminicoccaceae bacterium]|nr:MAG: 50S ribosomal protein L11 methyltransferase [Geminicoccaceae bacterium]
MTVAVDGELLGEVEPLPELWQVRFPIPADDVDEVLAVVDEASESLAAYEEEGQWVCELIMRHAPDLDELRWRLEHAIGEDVPAESDFTVERLAAQDWLEATRRAFPPIAVGRFWVHGSHVDAPPPAGHVPLLIDAGLAFGTGEHGSTHGCLVAIDRLARRHRFKRVLDMGCGTAILAIAAVKCWPGARALAVDIDPLAAVTAQTNARVNGVGGRVRTGTSDGYDRPELRRTGRFDLILANILAGPLCRMAPDLAISLAPGGHAVLAGLLSTQADAVAEAHRRVGLKLLTRYTIGPWATLVLTKARGHRRRPRVPHRSHFHVTSWAQKGG